MFATWMYHLDHQGKCINPLHKIMNKYSKDITDNTHNPLKITLKLSLKTHDSPETVGTFCEFMCELMWAVLNHF